LMPQILQLIADLTKIFGVDHPTTVAAKNVAAMLMSHASNISQKGAAASTTS
jgi:hypothetical protein